MDTLKENLLLFNRKTISIDELEKLSPRQQNYEQFASAILTLENENVLQMVASKGRNHRIPSLAHHYRIRKQPLNEGYFKELQTYRIKFHNAISLDTYFDLDLKQWKCDLPYIEKINAYIEENDFPQDYAPAPERSFALVGDEKWIERSGEEILHRLQLWDSLKIMPVADPLMFAINPQKINQKEAYHLIVENKTTYQALLPVLSESDFATLIYGVGKKIIKSIENFATQYPTKSEQHFFYFGDIDREGISIWHKLNEKQTARPALAFYEACLSRQASFGKTNQVKNTIALAAFLPYFSIQAKQVIEKTLENGAYFPQEILKTEELQTIFLTTNWAAIISE